MLKETLAIFPGISYRRQKYLKKNGIITWEDLLEKGREHFSPESWEILRNEVEKAIENYDKGNIAYFREIIDRRDHYLLYSDFRDRAAFLDIETTGMGTENEITLIGISNYRKNYRVFVNGINMGEESVTNFLKNFSIIVTFYGSRFDIPFISSKFPGLGEFIRSMVHVDLCILGHRVGFKGGLKTIERQIGLERERDIDGLTGFDAVVLWKKYRSGDMNALERLIRYNRRDVLNLVDLIEIEIRLMKEFYDLTWE